MDPDYEVTDSLKQQAKEREEKDIMEHLERIKTIVSKEFKAELVSRENQLEEIQKKLSRAAKTLHLLRYVLISSYYNRNEVQYQQTEEELNVTDCQSQIHPAVKRIIGEDMNFGVEWSRRKSTRTNKYFDNLVIQESPDKTLKQAEEIPNELATTIIPEENTPVAESNPEMPVRNRQMLKKRIVVGNISKWMPSESSGDNSTHKWMVYVRGPKASPNVDDFVRKVVFYLHPSYQPNDVIELTSPPFHLSRRGWGEFPLRVQIYFHFVQNKPVDIIHNLKLDKTYTGHQTLGNETIADVTLYTSEVSTFSGTNEVQSPTVKVEVNDDNCGNNNEMDIITEANFNPLFDHTYSLSHIGENMAPNKSDDNVSESTMLTSDGKLIHFRKRKRPPESLLKMSIDKRLKCEDIVEGATEINYEKHRIKFPVGRFKTVTQALPYLLKYLPLINQLAENLDYKCTYPYTAKSLEEFVLWPVEKRQSCEWSRAKYVQKFIRLTNMDVNNFWTTKKILSYARAHGYTELANYRMLKSRSYEEEYLSDPVTVSEPKFCIKLEKDIQVDVTKDDDAKEKQSTLTLIEPHLCNASTFVKQAALDVGVLLQPEEIIPGVTYNASQRILLQAALCLAENLIRNASGILAHQNCYNEENAVVGVEEVTTVLKTHRPEFEQILNFDKESVKY